ncbi:hypothetical protein PMA4326_017755 [Pseudomonas syringae pv. maculicola str. ES4326]|uniref:Uncharacterized protein n=1 Tax=Pseudomonas syringae pv. maculicola str. ES4326 TaxID=629265 RepID=A0A8T8C3J5_PSEYM|nr:hypothetical protein PMA4326_017755 [Pseudomonas syringae pv. maculicola str. ES4326]
MARMRLARRPASHPPDQRQGSAVTYVAIGVVSAIAIEKHIKSTVPRATARTLRHVVWKI